jgi:hypothetical protein
MSFAILSKTMVLKVKVWQNRPIRMEINIFDLNQKIIIVI